MLPGLYMEVWGPLGRLTLKNCKKLHTLLTETISEVW